MHKINKKAAAGEQILFLPYFAMFVFLAIGLAAAVILYFGGDYQVRQTYANILSNNLKSCLAKNTLAFTASNQDNGNLLFEKCKIAPEIAKSLIIEIKENGNIVYTRGDRVSCFLNNKNPSFPKCTSSQLDKPSSLGTTKYEILAGSKLVGREEVG